MSADRNPRNQLLIRVERHLESSTVLGFQVGEGEDVVDFLARLEMEAVEHLLRSALPDAERERVLNWIEERKGELGDDELPAEEARRRCEHRERLRKWRR